MCFQLPDHNSNTIHYGVCLLSWSSAIQMCSHPQKNTIMPSMKRHTEQDAPVNRCLPTPIFHHTPFPLVNPPLCIYFWGLSTFPLQTEGSCSRNVTQSKAQPWSPTHHVDPPTKRPLSSTPSHRIHKHVLTGHKHQWIGFFSWQGPDCFLPLTPFFGY